MLTKEQMCAITQGADRISEIVRRVLRLNREGITYDLSYNGEVGWLTLYKWVAHEHDDEWDLLARLVWRASSPAGGEIFGERYYSLGEILAWLAKEAQD